MKWLAGTAAILVVLVAAAALAVTWWFDADALKAEISDRVQGETGLELEISGELTPVLFPGVGVQVGRTALRNPPRFGSDNLAEFDLLTVRLKLLPLLQGRVALDRVTVEKLRLTLLRGDSGRHNFEPLLSPGDDSGRPPPLLAPIPLVVSDAALSYADQASGESFEIADLQLRIDPQGDGQRAALAARFGFSHPTKKVNGETSVDAELSADAVQQTLAARVHLNQTTLRGTGVPGGRLAIEGRVDGRFDAAAGLLSLEELHLDARGPALAESPLSLRVPTAAVNFGAGTASTEHFLVELLGMTLKGDFTVEGLGREAALRASVTTADLRPAELMRRLGRPLPDSLEEFAPREARFEAVVYADGGGIRVESVDATAERLRLRGQLTLGFDPQRPLSFALELAGPLLAAERPVTIALRASARAPEDAAVYPIDEVALTLGPATALGRGEIVTGSEGLRYTASLTLTRFDARALLDYLGQSAPKLGDPTALTRLSAAAVITGSNTELKLEPFNLSLDDTQVRGVIEISELSSAAPAISFMLQADALNTQRYLPAASAESEPGAAAWRSLAFFDALKLNGRLGVEALTVGEWVMNDVEIEARSRNGRIELQTGSAPQGSVAKHIAGAQLPEPAAP